VLAPLLCFCASASESALLHVSKRTPETCYRFDATVESDRVNFWLCDQDLGQLTVGGSWMALTPTPGLSLSSP
jgi:hypothetical protein